MREGKDWAALRAERELPCSGEEDCQVLEAAISEMFVHGRKCFASRRSAVAQALREAEAEGRGWAVEELAEPYHESIFPELTDSECATIQKAMSTNLNARLHASWARHWARNLKAQIVDLP